MDLLHTDKLQKYMKIMTNIVIVLCFLIVSYFCFFMGAILISVGKQSSSFIVGCVPVLLGIIFHIFVSYLTIYHVMDDFIPIPKEKFPG